MNASGKYEQSIWYAVYGAAFVATVTACTRTAQSPCQVAESVELHEQASTIADHAVRQAREWEESEL